MQLYGVDPSTVEQAVRMLRDEDRADHIDLNFGCPVPKVTRKGGGAALPWKLDLFREIVERAVQAAGPLPLTVKMRKGIDADHLTYLEAGRIAEGAGVASMALHARTAAEFYSGTADWSAITKLKETVTSVPVLGNGDIWSADDAVRMMAETGCDGVVVGRGCLGRPWLFGDLAAAFGAGDDRRAPSRRWARSRRPSGATRSCSSSSSATTRMGASTAAAATSASTWPGTSRATASAGPRVPRWRRCESLQQLDDLLGTLDADQPYPGEAAEGQRGRAGSPKSPALPERWLDSRSLDADGRSEIAGAELDTSGG